MSDINQRIRVLMGALGGAPASILLTLHLQKAPMTARRLSRLSGFPYETTFKSLLLLMVYDLITWSQPPKGSILYRLKVPGPDSAPSLPGRSLKPKTDN